MNSETIRFDMTNGRISGANPVEWIGLNLMRLGAKLTVNVEYLGFSYGVRMVRALFSSNKNLRLDYSSDHKFDFPYGDQYWSTLLQRKRTYCDYGEPFLSTMIDVNYAFLDCGANYGYMSVLVTSDQYGNKPSIAIEADSGNFARLVHNCKVNGNRFECLHNAIYSESGVELDLFGAKHEAFSVVGESGQESIGKVMTLAIDDLMAWVEQQNADAVVLKLDVEGVEIDALKGSKRMLSKNCLVMYEEHGNDPKSEVSHFLAEELGMRLFFADIATGKLTEFASYDQLAAMKKSSRVGYDFFATNSPFWLDQIAAKGGSLRSGAVGDTSKTTSASNGTDTMGMKN